MAKPLWTPSAKTVESAAITRFSAYASQRWDIEVSDYTALHRWSVDQPAQFWATVWHFCDVKASASGEAILNDPDQMPGAVWFAGAKLNFAENLLRRSDAGLAIIARAEGQADRTISYAELQRQVSQLTRAFQSFGIQPGDRIAALMPNIPETMICMLAAAACGAVWSSCSPDFGARGVIDRFGQIEPKILLCTDGYTYSGKTFDLQHKLAAIRSEIPSLEQTIVVPYLADPGQKAIPQSIRWNDFFAGQACDPIAFEHFRFNHPLYILFSSGTTGAPKCIVHGAGGTLLQHLKEHQLHVNLRPNEKLFFFTTCGWMMWNWLATALASNATVVLYEGSPFAPDASAFFQYIDDWQIDHFGISAKYIDAIAKSGIRPRETHHLASLKSIMSTGSPLNPEGFDYIYDAVKQDVCLSSISGGTDLISCFVLGNSTLPVWRGEIQCKGLGMDVAVLDDSGQALPSGKKGELACRKPFPSMPTGFWKDPDGSKYRAAYFEKFPGIWHHGDYAELTEHGGMVIYGRSDAVLNPSGVRIGTAEIYRQAEQVEAVVESLVIGQKWDGDTRIVLFVKLREGLELTAELTDKIKQIIRSNESPRHVPAKIIQVRDIPRTKNGKITEVAVRKIVHGETVDNLEALGNPQSLEFFRDLPQLQTN